MQKGEKFTRVIAGEEGGTALSGDNSNTLVVELVRLQASHWFLYLSLLQLGGAI